MHIKMAAERVLIPLLLLLTMANCRLEINFQRPGNKVQLRCSEISQEGISNVLTDPNLLQCNTSRLVVTTLLETVDIAYEFDSETGFLSFEVLQEVEGYYFCARDEDTSSELTILAHPDRNVDIPETYEVQVGKPVTLRNGVGEGKLANHYLVQWYKGFDVLAGANISRGDDLSLLLSSVQLSDNGSYFSMVTVVNDDGDVEHNVGPDIVINLVVYQIPRVERPPIPIVVVQEDGGSESVSFDCFATGGPQLQVSWFKNGYEKLRANYSSHYKIENDNSGTSRLTINDVTHLDSGVYRCVATILGHQSDEFTTQGNGTLTVLDSHFNLKTVVTEDQQLQLWVQLQIPLPDTVGAVVYLTSMHDSRKKPRNIVTSSAFTNSTMMIFQLEPSDIPDDYREGDFRVQVALRVGLTEGPLVPSNLEEADIANLDEPTGSGCDETTKYQIPFIVAGSVAGIALIAFTILAITVCCYKCIIKRAKLNRLTREERRELEKECNQLVENIIAKRGNSHLSTDVRKGDIKDLKESLKHKRGRINGDCDSNDTTNTKIEMV